jgi:hypothetical protein
MASADELRQKKRILSEATLVNDNGGTRAGMERRRQLTGFEGDDRRSGRNRRRGFDRRAGIDRRRTDDRRIGRFFWDGEGVERRDAFRKRSGG